MRLSVYGDADMTLRTRLTRLEQGMMPPAAPLVLMEDDPSLGESIAQAKRLGRAVVVASYLDANL
jgi:hypothetical protein